MSGFRGALVAQQPGTIYQLTAGTSGANVGFSRFLAIGTLTPNDATIATALDVSGTTFSFSLTGLGNVGSSYYRTLYINGVSYSFAGASYSFSNPFATWTWGGQPAGLTNGNNYVMSIL